MGDREDGDRHPRAREVAICIAVDHGSEAGVGSHAAKKGTRCEALEPIRQGVRTSFQAFGQTSPLAWSSGMIMGGNRSRTCFKRNGHCGVSSVRPPWSVHPKATAVQHASSGRSRSISYGLRPLIPWKNAAAQYCTTKLGRSSLLNSPHETLQHADNDL